MSPAPEPRHRRLRQLAVAATATTFVLIAVGALVRATGSGLGCTGWPKCSAHRWLPPLEYHALVEYTHRMTAFVDVVLVALLAVFAWRRYRGERRVFRPAVAAAILVVFQAVLGGIVVKGDLHALLVTAHFMTAMILAGTLVVATVAAFSVGMAASPIRSLDRVGRLAWVTAAGLFALLGVGAYVRGEGAGLVFGDWPLMDGRLIPRLSHLAAALHFAHRALALTVFVLALVFAVAAWRARSRRPAMARLALAGTGLFAAQILVGAANVWSHLAPAAVTAHVAVAGLLWGTVVAAAEASRLSSPRPVDRSVILPPDGSNSFVESHAGRVRP
jgi:heme A synthase